MGIIEQILKNNEGLIFKFLEILEGKETKTKFDLNGIKLKIGKTDVRLGGHIEVSVIPLARKK